MKRQSELGLGSSIVITIVFAIMALYTYQIDGDSSYLAWIPGFGVLAGIIYSIIAAVQASNKKAMLKQQQDAAKSIKHDSYFGRDDLKLYFDSTTSKVIICATTKNEAKQEEITNFVLSKAVETDNYIVAIDLINHKILRARNENGIISKEIYSLHEELKNLGISLKNSNPSLKTYNNYAFVTDDINEFIAIVTPTKIHVHRYSDIVNVSYVENGSEAFSKSLGGAIAGGILFGGVGAIVGANAASAKQNKEIKKMSVKILLGSTMDSTITLSIYKAGEDGPVLNTKNDIELAKYEILMREADGIKDIFSIIIDIIDKKNANSNTDSNPLVSYVSVADELKNLAKLKDDGILSVEEFNELKTKLLNK